MEDTPLCRPSFALDEAAPEPAKRRGSLFGVVLMPAVVALACFGFSRGIVARGGAVGAAGGRRREGKQVERAKGAEEGAESARGRQRGGA